MKLTVKRISGPDCSIEVSMNDGVLSLKKLVEEKLSAPAQAVRLVFKGRTLTDDKTVRECGLQEGDKLYAVIKKDVLSTPPPTCVRIADTSPLYRQLNTLLKKHFREQDAEKVQLEFQKEFQMTINSLSLDDIERLATVNLQGRQ